MDGNSSHSGIGGRRENKRYTSITNDEADEDEMISRGDNLTNEADDMQNVDENPAGANEVQSIGVYGSVGSGTELSKIGQTKKEGKNGPTATKMFKEFLS